MHHSNTRPFLIGLLTGIAITISAAVMLALDDGSENRRTERGQRVVEPMYFVTGDTMNATLWRRNANGSLTCVSRNYCRSPEQSRSR